MNNKLYYWAENVDSYTSDNDAEYNKVIEIKRLNFFIGKNNAGKSRFLRSLYSSDKKIKDYNFDDMSSEMNTLRDFVKTSRHEISNGHTYGGSHRENLLKVIDQTSKLPKFPIDSYIVNFLDGFN